MAVIRTRKFKNTFETDTFLAGGVIGSANVLKGERGLYGVEDLVGKTLIFTAPSVVTVTFVAGATPGRLTFKEIKTQIETAIAAVSVRAYDNRLLLIEVTPTSGVGVNKTGTGNVLLGFDVGVNTVGKVYGTNVATPPAVGSVALGPDGTILVATVE